MTGSADYALTIRGLRKSYGTRRAVDGLDLSVPRGVVYGFLGPNGAGKTTTMRVLTGLIHPDAGTIEMLGRPFRRGERRRLFGVGALVESPSFYPYLSGRANLRELASNGGHVDARRIEDLLDLVGLCERAGDKVQGYSLGMKQRLGIAAALLSDPELLLLDEPANGLDPAGIVALRDTLRQLAAQGKTVLVSSHLLAEVQVMADVVGIIAAGRLIREGPLRELLAGEGTVKARVRPAQVADAIAALKSIGPAEPLTEPDAEPGWISVQVGVDRAEEVNRTLAERGIYLSALTAGTDLEMLFLELTAGHAMGSEGTFAGLPVTGSGTTSGSGAGTAGRPR